MAKQVAQRQIFKKENVRRKTMFQVSGDACHMSHANSHSLGRLTCSLPQYEQQDAADDLDLDPSIMS